MTLGQIVKNARMKKGWTQLRLGKEVALGQASISALEHDEQRPGSRPFTFFGRLLSDGVSP